MVKHKKEPKKGTKAGYAARTADPVLDKTRSDESNSDSSSSSNDAPVAPPQPKTKAPAPAAPPERLNKAAKSLLTIKKRSKQGTRALKEIKRLQKSTDLLIPKAPFLRLVTQIFLFVESLLFTLEHLNNVLSQTNLRSKISVAIFI